MAISDKSKVFLNTSIITVSTIAEKILFFVINVIIARYLNLDHYGEYTTAIAFASFFSAFTDFGIHQTLIREISFENEYIKAINHIILLKAVLSVLLYIVFLTALFFTNYSVHLLYLTIIFGLVRFGDDYLRLYYTYFEAQDKYLKSSNTRLLFVFLFLIATLVVVFFKGGNSHIAWSRLFIIIAFMIILTRSITNLKAFRINFIYIKSIIKKTIPFASTFISTNIINQGNLIILSLLHGSLYTGLFQNGYLFITTLLFIPGTFGRVFVPFLYHANREKAYDKFQFAFDILTKVYAGISFYIMTILYFYSDFIITTIFGTQYASSIPLLTILSIGVPFIFNAASILITSLDKQSFFSRTLKYIALLYIISNIILGYLFRDKGIAIATVITFFLIFLVSNVILKIHSDVEIRNSIFSYLKGAVIFAVCWLVFPMIHTTFTVVSAIIISMVYMFLFILMFIGKDDLRIGREILAGLKMKK